MTAAERDERGPTVFRISSTELRDAFAEILRRAEGRGEVTIITHYRRDAAAVIPIHMLPPQMPTDDDRKQPATAMRSKLKRNVAK